MREPKAIRKYDASSALGAVERTKDLLASDLPALTPRQEKEAPEEAMAEDAVNEGLQLAVPFLDTNFLSRPTGSLTARTAGMLSAYRREPTLTAEEERAATEQAIAEDVVRRMGQ